MKAVVLTAHGEADRVFKIQEIKKPTISANEVLIKVEAFGLNFADVMARRGLYNDAPPIPSVLGYDAVGEVVEVGNANAEKYIGKRVVAMTRFGGYAEYVKTQIDGISIIPNDLNSGKAAALADS